MSSQASNEHETLVFTLETRDMTPLVQAAESRLTDVNSFILESAMQAAREVVDTRPHIHLSERDTLMVLDLLENPPAPSDTMVKAAQRLPK